VGKVDKAIDGMVLFNRLRGGRLRLRLRLRLRGKGEVTFGKHELLCFKR
jgi:hypothetical protein